MAESINLFQRRYKGLDISNQKGGTNKIFTKVHVKKVLKILYFI